MKNCFANPVCVTREQHYYKCLHFRKFRVVSPLPVPPATTTATPFKTTNLGTTFFATGYDFIVPQDWQLWGLAADYPPTWVNPDGNDGRIQIGANNVPIPVRPGVAFNLDRDEFPCLVGPLHCFLNELEAMVGTVNRLRWYAILAEI